MRNYKLKKNNNGFPKLKWWKILIFLIRSLQMPQCQKTSPGLTVRLLANRNGVRVSLTMLAGTPLISKPVHKWDQEMDFWTINSVHLATLLFATNVKHENRQTKNQIEFNYYQLKFTYLKSFYFFKLSIIFALRLNNLIWN